MTTDDKNLARSAGFQGILRALRHRNFRLFFIGQGFSVIGTWMQSVAMSWLVYRLTGSAFLLGFIGFVSQVPSFLVAPFSGVLADRWDRRHVLIATQGVSMVQAFILAAVVLTGTVQVWEIIVLSAVLGLVNGFDVTFRQSFVVEMVEGKEDLGNAIALNSTMFHGARFIGPSLAGLLIVAVGEGACFVINGVSYLAVITSLLLMKTGPRTSPAGQRRILPELREGISYAFTSAPIRSVLMLVALVSLVGMPHVVLMPVFAKEILHGGPHTFGFLMTAAGMGSFTAALYLASRKSVVGLGRIIAIAPGILGVSIAAFAFSPYTWLSMALLVFAGIGMMLQIAASNTFLQTIVDDDKRGRVVSLFAMAFLGVAPFGSLLTGALASRIGAPLTVLIGGLCCIAGSASFVCWLPGFRKIVRPIYERMGIIPGAATGIEAPSELTLPPDEH
ncbi:MAG: MFS transporter [Syntrophaceae bacterium]